MGICGSRGEAERDSSSRRLGNPSTNQVVTGGNKPLVAFDKYVPTIKKESSLQILSKRNTFWDTEPSYSGRIEIWQMLRMACEADLGTAQAIIDSEGLVVPTGKLDDGVYDQQGNLYKIPNYCIGIIEIKESDLLGGGGNSMVEISKSAPNSVLDLEVEGLEITLRLSTGKDIKMKASPTWTMTHVKKALCQLEGYDPNTVKLTFLIVGKMIDMDKKVKDANLTENSLLQVFITEIAQS